MKNYADRGGCYLPKPITPLHTKAEFKNRFIIHSKYFQSFKKDKFTLLSSVTNCKVDKIQQFSLQILINHAKLENK